MPRPVRMLSALLRRGPTLFGHFQLYCVAQNCSGSVPQPIILNGPQYTRANCCEPLYERQRTSAWVDAPYRAAFSTTHNKCIRT